MSLFKKSLNDLVKGIRSNKDREDEYISTCIAEIKDELRSKEMNVKVVAIQKLTFVKKNSYSF
jgi:AP-3 complex subunit delta